MPIDINKKNRSKRVQVAKVGTFDHEIYGKFSIKLPALKQMKSNFDANVRRQKLDGNPVAPFDYKHDEENIAAGWIKGLAVEDDENGVKALFAEVEWTPKGAQKVRDREFAFVSPSIDPAYKDKETGKKFSNVLKGATLTNIPFLRDMEAVHLLSESKRSAFESLKLSGDNPDTNSKTGNKMTFEEILKELDLQAEDKKKLSEAFKNEGESGDKKLSEGLEKSKKDLKKSQDELKLSEEKIKTLETKMSGSGELEDRLKLAEGEAKEQKKKTASLIQKMAETDKKAEFDIMLSGGKVCEAQRESYMKQDFAAYAKNAQEVKLDESGTNSKGDETAYAAEEKVQKLAEEKMKNDKNLDYGGAMKIVLSENHDLRNKLGY